MRSLRWIVPAAAALLITVPPALAADLSNTTWSGEGRAGMWARGMGRSVGTFSTQITFSGDGLFTVAEPTITGTWQAGDGRRFVGEVDDAVLEAELEGVINAVAGVDDADVLEVRIDRVSGRVNEEFDRVKMKIRVRVWFSSASLGIEEHGARIKLRLRGRPAALMARPSP